MLYSIQGDSYISNTVWKQVKFSTHLKLSKQEEDILNKAPHTKLPQEKKNGLDYSEI